MDWRMIHPPAVQRWAERAIRRAMPSILQAYLCGLVEQEIFAASGADKSTARTFSTAVAIKTWADRHAENVECRSILSNAYRWLQRRIFDARLTLESYYLGRLPSSTLASRSLGHTLASRQREPNCHSSCPDFRYGPRRACWWSSRRSPPCAA
jgi:hypothetical protein